MKNTAQLIAENKAWIDATYEKMEKKLRAMAVRSRDIIPYGVDENGRHIDVTEKIAQWTNGFFGGLNAMMYEYTGAVEYLECAKAQEKKLDRALREKWELLHHDVGFQWHILSGALWRITGDRGSLARNFYAANTLAGRFNIDGGYITAWNGEKHQNWTIIDSLMNIPQLYWLSRELGDDRYKRIAMAHADMAMCDHLRDDGSVAHIVEHDRETGEVVRTFGGQGYAEGTSWSRGQSWAVYGFTLSYIHTGEYRYLNAAKRVANYFIANCCDDWLPRIDFRAPAEPVYYDSTAGVITACGLIELGKILPEGEGGMYTHAALKMLHAIEESFGNFDEDNDCMIGYGSGRYPVPGQFDEKTAGVHMSIIYGDYYFAEAILKLRGSEFNPW